MIWLRTRRLPASSAVGADARSAGCPDRGAREFSAGRSAAAERHPRGQSRGDSDARRRHPVRRCLSACRAKDAIRSWSRGRLTVTERFPSCLRGRRLLLAARLRLRVPGRRGRHESDGRWEPFFDDEKDGYDTIEWAAKQRWSNGKVGMQGGSYLGQNQWRAAQAAPPSLVTIFPSVASTSIYHDWITLNGAWRLSFNFGWGPVRQESRIMQNPGPHTDRVGCTRFTTTRFSGTCRSTRCSSWWDATPASTTTGWPIPTTTTTGSRSTSRRGSTRSRSRCIRSAAGSTFSARERCADTWG